MRDVLKEKIQYSNLYVKTKSNVKTNNEKKKFEKKTTVLKEDKQVFGVIAIKATDLHEIFSDRIASLPQSIAFLVFIYINLKKLTLGFTL